MKIGYQAYHMNPAGPFGNTYYWMYQTGPQAGEWCRLQRNKMHSVKGYIRLNTLGRADGVLMGWLDGELGLHESGLEFRAVDRLKIEEFWLDVYHGGAATAADAMHFDIDNIQLEIE